jgi:cell division protein FtsB
LYIALNDIGLFILFLLAAAVGVYLILVLRQALQTLCRVQTILAAQDSAIQQSLTKLPGLLANLDELSTSLKQSADFANTTLHSWQEDLTSTVDDLRDGLDTITVYSKAISEIVRAVVSK